MSIPQHLLEYLENYYQISIQDQSSVSGGSINQAAHLKTNQGDLFLKWNIQANPDMFGKEAKGLHLLRNADTELYIPEVIAFQDQPGKISGFLLMEYINPQRGSTEAAENFGVQLARLHNHHNEMFGLDHDNYIGRLPQSNSKHSSWVQFFIEERIEPQLKIAIDKGALNKTSGSHWEKLSDKLGSIFPDAKPSLLHGDLWGGNYFFDVNFRPVLIDPAVYYGHPEMELAFTRMFGGFSERFYDSYASAAGLASGFTERVPIYNLYPLLVHVNLFGGHYAVEAKSLLKQYA